ncbi:MULTISPECIES: XdhC family protein [unclassified Rhodococcus (in: high G+C Gram-positive bacteria)]|uniref:XdhC family protein n=1 Tax=unclassified Rhodococcus (in: high G+C Gram-positive bacteria) TaxID=192944 RepID=UPI000B9B7576|nr:MULTISPECIES: XdhC family protein [unclassified Rhodococcus (in: high G+C Gram-positive bacteria)]OZE37560.1 XshC-Cox1 family protein [Rhodococcus sp. 05-2254-4]OZE40692.1 XshC-Cox1 family protein [Rhodococcus sp. 05-2254-3]OZE45683.1 XshC-Cox1 family protein [Rhodococcus sp. 05-2254-2]OZE87788.1 XshC-Cox1 family protein [Rhodococcus sp. 15-649-2-2]
MHELLDDISSLLETSPVALARVVATSGAGPRAVGASMVVTADGEPLGSLSAGCVESVVIHTAVEVIRTGTSARELFGYSDPDAIEIGLPCGGEIEVFIERIDPSHRQLIDRLIVARDQERQFALVTVLSDQPRRFVLGDPKASLDNGWARELPVSALAVYESGSTGIVEDAGDCARVFVHTFPPPPRMILAGANDFVRALGASATLLGYRVTVVDARPVFATTERFPNVHEVVVDWPHRYLKAEDAAGRLDARTVVCVMTHDSKFDVPMLVAALKLDELAFVGALGSRRTHSERLGRLRATGLPEHVLARVNSPLGLDLDARSPEETAISILAQLIADRSGASGQRLRQLDGPIHRQHEGVGVDARVSMNAVV